MAQEMKYNAKHPAVKRIVQEIRELHKEDSPDMMAEALEDNIFEWHFAIRGPPDTDFESGIYHGRILLPAEYPFKPPAFMLLTPNGRWETGVKICLSISSHHPEHWQPSWSVRTALLALVAFMPSHSGGAIGALDAPKAERQQLAAQSREKPPTFGDAGRQEVTHSIHERMLAAEKRSKEIHETKPGSVPQSLPEPPQPASPSQEASQPDQHDENKELSKEPPLQARETAQPSQSQQESVPARLAHEQASAEAGPQAQSRAPTVLSSNESQPAAQGTCRTTQQPQWQFQQPLAPHTSRLVHESGWEEKGLSFLAAAFMIAIVAIIGRRALLSAGVDIKDFF